MLGLFAGSAFAQASDGRLVGTVSDASGVVPGATVTVTDTQTGKEVRTVVASDDGSFTVPQLKFGVYMVKVTASGHKTFTVTDVKIDVGRDYTLNATLEVGDINESVTVVGGADVINSQNAELSNTVGQRQILELPLNGRNPLNLITLQPGVSVFQNINGQRFSSTSYFRDGLNVQDNFIRSGFVPDRPNADDTGEFTVVTQNAGVDLGYGSSIVQLVTPRGGDVYHGAIFEYNRNSKFAANNFFSNAAGKFVATDAAVIQGRANVGDDRIPRPFLNRNQFGGKGSGPIPFTKKKIFFFGSYEGFRLRQATQTTRTILTPSARTGVFSFTTTPSAAQQALGIRPTIVNVNVLTLAGLAGVDPTIAARILANVPTAGNRTDIGDGRTTTGLGFNITNNTDREAVTTRFDGDINERNTVNVVYSWRTENIQRPDVAAAGFSITPDAFQTATTKFLAIGYTMSPSPSWTNEVRGGFQKSGPVFDNPSVVGRNFLLTLPLISNPENNFRYQGRNQDYWNFQDNATYIRGNHSFRFGGVYQSFKFLDFNQASNLIPTYTLSNANSTTLLSTASFNGQAGCTGGCISTADLATANALVGLLGGIVNSGTITFNAPDQASGFNIATPFERNESFKNFGFYFSDQWRLRPNLTLNLGVRYELYTPFKEENGLFIQPVIPEGTDPVAAILNPNGFFDFIGVNAGGGNRASKMDKDNFAPSISVAWSPQWKNKFMGMVLGNDGRSVIRGGFRVGYVNDEYLKSQINALGFGEGLTQQSTLTSLDARLNAVPALPVPVFSPPPRSYALNNARASLQGTIFAVDPNFQMQRTLEWNFGIQREIGWQTALEVRYVGGMSNSMVRTIDYNQIDIRSNGFAADFQRARANFINFGNPACTAVQAAATGCQVLTVFPNLSANAPGFTNLPAGGGLATTTVRNALLANTPADLAVTYAVSGVSPALFLPNPNTFVGNLLTNGGKFRHNSLQIEFRRRFAQGFYFQANYSFQKTLGNTNAEGGGAAGQNRVDPFLDNANPQLEYSRVEFDQTHIFNFNGIYELPFGKGKRWLNEGGLVNQIVGGWQVTSIIQIGSGIPFSITDPRGTLNRAARSTRNTAFTNLSKDEVKKLFGTFDTPCGLFFINPAVINIDLATCGARTGTLVGRAALGFGSTLNQATFPGQVFFNVEGGQVGNLERAIGDSPSYMNWDASLIKNFDLGGIREGMRLQLRVEAFNLLNQTTFTIAQQQNINSSTFGRLTSTLYASRVVQFAGRFEF
jgi:hypothetical protein